MSAIVKLSVYAVFFAITAATYYVVAAYLPWLPIISMLIGGCISVYFKLYPQVGAVVAGIAAWCTFMIHPIVPTVIFTGMAIWSFCQFMLRPRSIEPGVQA